VTTQPYSRAAHQDLLREATLSLTRAASPAGCSLLRCEGTCEGYHRGWVLLQYLGLISGLALERDCIVPSLAARLREKQARKILIAGCADFGILSMLHEAAREAVSNLHIEVVDLCETPLALCDLYAAKMGFQLSTMRANVVDEELELGRYDLIITHSLLSFVQPASRPALLTRLGSLLCETGTLLVYQSIREGPTPSPLHYEDAEIVAIIRRASTESADKLDAIEMPIEMAASYIEAFCRAKQTYSVTGIEAIIADAAGALVPDSIRETLDSRTATHIPATTRSHFSKVEIAFSPTASSQRNRD